jgi:hypothetical protein
MASTAKHPLFGFWPRQVTSKQVQGAVVRVAAIRVYIFSSMMPLQEGKENPFTRLPHSPQYFKILEARKKLPVFTQMDEFYKMVSPALPFICEGAIEPAPQVAPGIKAVSLIPQQSLLNIRSSSWLEKRALGKPLSTLTCYPFNATS